MYRYFKLIENKIIKLDEYIIKLPQPAYYHKEWEWKYTFTQIFNNIKQDLRYKLSLLLLYLCKRMNMIDLRYSTEYRTKEINNTSLNKHIDQVIKELNYTNLLYNNKCMIIFGSDVAGEVFKWINSYETMYEFKFSADINNQRLIFYHNIPVVFYPHISGLHILPDMTGKWNEKIELDFNFSTYRTYKADFSKQRYNEYYAR